MLGVRLTEVSILQRCPLREIWLLIISVVIIYAGPLLIPAIADRAIPPK